MDDLPADTAPQFDAPLGQDGTGQDGTGPGSIGPSSIGPGSGGPNSGGACANCRNSVPPADGAAHRARTLSETDAAILQLLAAGSSSVKIATRLHMSRQAVDYHIHAMLRSFKVSNRPGLVSKAYAMGVMVVGSWPPEVRRVCVR